MHSDFSLTEKGRERGRGRKKESREREREWGWRGREGECVCVCVIITIIKAECLWVIPLLFIDSSLIIPGWPTPSAYGRCQLSIKWC